MEPSGERTRRKKNTRARARPVNGKLRSIHDGQDLLNFVTAKTYRIASASWSLRGHHPGYGHELHYLRERYRTYNRRADARGKGPCEPKDSLV